MKMQTTKRRWLGAALLALMGAAAGRAEASVGSSTATLNIDVTITAVMSVNITGVIATTATANWNGVLSSVTATSSVTVTNDSSIVTERWKLSTTATSWPTGTGTGSWTINNSSSNLPADYVSVQAVFGSSNTTINGCAATTSTGTWNLTANAPVLTTVAQQYTFAGVLGSPELVASGGLYTPDVNSGPSGAMYGNGSPNGGVRALCWRLVMPPSTSVTGTQVVPITVTAY